MRRAFALFALTLPAILIATTGCTTPRHERPTRAAGSMQEFEKLLASGSEQTVRIDAAIDDLLKADAAGVSEAYARFSKEADTLRAIGKRCADESERMKSLSLKYFKKWERDLALMSNADLQAMSKERREKLTGSYREIETEMASLRGAYEAYDEGLLDLQRFVGNDPTRAGRDLAGPFLKRITSESAAIRNDVADLQAVISRLKLELKPN